MQMRISPLISTHVLRRRDNILWDLKLFYNEKAVFVIAHSDGFRWFGSKDTMFEWDALIKNFNEHKYMINDCTLL